MYLCIIKIYPSAEMEHVIVDVLESLKGPSTANADCLDCTITVGTVLSLKLADKKQEIILRMR